MPKITSVEPQTFRLRSGSNRRFNIFLDGTFAFGADEDLVVEYRLVIGKEINPLDLEKFLFEAEVGKLMQRMYRLFNVRLRSEKEVKDYLRNLSFRRKIKDQEEISEVATQSLIAKLKTKGLLNDEVFARLWVEARRKTKKKGKIALKLELYQKGIDKDIIDELLKQTLNQDEEKLAEQALDKKLRIWKNLPFLELKKKAYEFLMRRGFEYEVVKKVVEKFLQKE